MSQTTVLADGQPMCAMADTEVAQRLVWGDE